MALPRIRGALQALPAIGNVVLPSHALTAAIPGAAHDLPAARQSFANENPATRVIPSCKEIPLAIKPGKA